MRIFGDAGDVGQRDGHPAGVAVGEWVAKYVSVGVVCMREPLLGWRLLRRCVVVRLVRPALSPRVRRAFPMPAPLRKRKPGRRFAWWT